MYEARQLVLGGQAAAAAMGGGRSSTGIMNKQGSPKENERVKFRSLGGGNFLWIRSWDMSFGCRWLLAAMGELVVAL
jgi:hypothetical protein